LGTSVFDSDVYLVGASGGVYALLAAHLANVVLNYNQMELGMLRLFGIFVVGMFCQTFKLFFQTFFQTFFSNLFFQTFFSNFFFKHFSQTFFAQQ
jgi:hypothetical protein